MGLFTNAEKATVTEPEKKPTGNGLLGLGGLLGLLTLITQPLVVILFTIFAIIGEKRRVRLSRWFIAAGAAWVVCILAAGADPAIWFGWWPTGTAMLFGDSTAFLKGIPLLAEIPTFAEKQSLIFIKHALFATPVALFLMALWWWARSYSLRLRGQKEGAEYSDRRPVGVLDNYRRKKNQMAVQSGQW